jgi:hypothetical protein
MKPPKKIACYMIVFIVLITLLHSSCAGKYWFRKKVNTEKDTTEVEKEFRVIW